MPVKRPCHRRRSALVVVIGAVAFARRGPARTSVDVGTAVRQAQFRSTVTASGEIVASQYADIGSSVMGKITALPVAEGDRVTTGQVLAQIDRVQVEADAAGAFEQLKALEAENVAPAGSRSRSSGVPPPRRRGHRATAEAPPQ
jgi:HlyD family secretion protein